MLLFRHGVRSAIACAGAAVLVVATAGCGGSGGSSSKVKLTLGWFMDGKTGSYKALLDAFKKKHPNVVVVEQSIPYDGYYQKLGAWTSAKQGPDAIALEPGALAEPYYKDMQPLDVKTFQSDMGNVTDPTAFCTNWDCNKGFYSIGFDSQGYPLYYNKDVFKQAGLDPNQPPRTFGEMKTACDAVKKIGKQCWEILGKTFGLPIVLAETALRVVTKQQMLDLATGKAKWTDPEFKQVLTLLDYMAKNGWYQDGWVASGEVQTPFVAGKAAFVSGFFSGGGATWSNLASTMGSDDKFGILPMPKLQPGDVPGVTPGPLNDTIGLEVGRAIVVPKWSKHPKEAEELIRTTLDPEVQRAMTDQRTNASFPSIKSAQPDWSPNVVFGDALKIAETSKAADLLTYMGYGYVSTLIAQLQQLSLGKTTVDGAAAALEKATEASRSK